MTNPPPPGYSAHAHAQSQGPAGSGSGSGPGSSAPTGPGNPAGRLALVFAVIAVGFGLFQQTLSFLLPVIMAQAGIGYGSIAGIFALLAVVSVLLSAGALAFGWYGATRRGLPQLTSGIGLGIGAAGVVSGVVGLIAAPIAGLLL